MAARNNIICNAKDIKSKRASEKEGKKQEKKNSENVVKKLFPRKSNFWPFLVDAPN